MYTHRIYCSRAYIQIQKAECPRLFNPACISYSILRWTWASIKSSLALMYSLTQSQQGFLRTTWFWFRISVRFIYSSFGLPLLLLSPTQIVSLLDLFKNRYSKKQHQNCVWRTRNLNSRAFDCAMNRRLIGPYWWDDDSCLQAVDIPEV